MIGLIVKCLVLVWPWPIRRRLLQKIYGYDIHKTAKIRCSWIFPKHLRMAAFSRIDWFNVAIHLDSIDLGEHSTIGRRNWITGFPSDTNSPHFAHQDDRVSKLTIGQHSAITKNHHIDCTSAVNIGEFSTIAGYHSQLLTHSVDLVENRQSSAPIEIGDFAFVGTKSVILGGSCLPTKSVLGACSLLSKKLSAEGTLYAGVPAKRIKNIKVDCGYFVRKSGFVE